MTYISKFTKIDDSKKTATIRKLFVGITDNDELYFLEVGNRGSQDFSISGDTVMKVSESSAEEYTKDRIRDYFEMDEGLSNINVLNYLDDSAESFFDDYQEESNRNYAEDILGESADGYPNRLAEELVERGIVDEEDAQKDDFDAEDYIDEFVEDMNNQEDSLEWFRFNFGEEEFAEVVRNNNLIDIDEVVDDVDWYDWFDNSTLTDEVLSDDGETFLFEAIGGGQNRDELDDLKITFLPESFINQLKKNWDKYHLKQLPKSEFFPEVEQDEQGILDFYVNEALDVYEAGGTLPTPFGQAGLVGETGTLNEIDLFAMGGGLPQGVHQYYAQTYNPAYPTPHGYAKGGMITSKMYDPEIHYQVVVNDDYDNPLYFKTFASAKKYTLANVKNQDNTIISPQGDSIEIEKNQSKKDLDFLFEYSMAKGGATSSDTSDVYFFAYEEFMKNGKKFKSEKELYDFVNDGYSFPKYSKKSVKSAFEGLNKEMYAKGGKVKVEQYGYTLHDFDVKNKKEAEQRINKLLNRYNKKRNNTSTYTIFYQDENGKITSWQKFAKGGKTQGYNDKLDESLGNTKGKRSTKEQNYKDRRNESEAMEKKGGKRKYARVKTMDKGNRKKRKTPMTLAKAIRRDGEKWQDAVKRATIMMKKDK